MTSEIRAFWKSLDDSQKTKLRIMAKEVTKIDIEDRLLTKIFIPKLISDTDISEDCKKFLTSHKFSNVEEVNFFGIDNFEMLKGYSSEFKKEIENI